MEGKKSPSEEIQGPSGKRFEKGGSRGAFKPNGGPTEHVLKRHRKRRLKGMDF